MLKCKTCDKILVGNQRKFCSIKCKGKETNYKFQRYEIQKERGFARKLAIFIERGGACEICGYNKNLAAIEFHHIDPTQKKVEVDLRSISNNSIATIASELPKCRMICSNCHREHHHPDSRVPDSYPLDI